MSIATCQPLRQNKTESIQQSVSLTILIALPVFWILTVSLTIWIYAGYWITHTTPFPGQGGGKRVFYSIQGPSWYSSPLLFQIHPLTRTILASINPSFPPINQADKLPLPYTFIDPSLCTAWPATQNSSFFHRSFLSSFFSSFFPTNSNLMAWWNLTFSAMPSPWP